MPIRSIAIGALAALMLCIDTDLRAQTHKRHRRHSGSPAPKHAPAAKPRASHPEPSLANPIPPGPPIPQEESLHLKQKKSKKVVIVPAPPPPPGRDPMPPDTRR